MVVFHEVEIDSFGMFGGTDDAEAVARERFGIELQTDIHILTSSRTKALTCRFGGVDL